MHVLSILNVSNPDRIHADSGYIFSNLIGSALCDLSHEFTSVSPVPLVDERSGHIYLPPPVNKYEARLRLPSNAVEDAILRTRPDVILVNQVEATAQVRAIAVSAGLTPKIASYCHYLPFTVRNNAIGVDDSLNDKGLWEPILFQFLSGLSASDVILVHSRTAQLYIHKLLRRHGITNRPVEIVAPPRDPKFVKSQPPQQPVQPVLIYNHRLYEHYGTARFLSLAKLISSRTDIKIIVLDPAARSSSVRRSFDPSPVKYAEQLRDIENVEVRDDVVTRSGYQGVLSQATVALAPFRENCTWSMSCVDCEGMGIPVIAPRMAWFKEHISESLLFDTEHEAVDLLAQLVGNAELLARESKKAIERTAPLDSSLIVHKLVSTFWLGPAN